MDTFTDNDYEVLSRKLTAKKAFKYEDVKDRLIKIAFDIVRFRDADASIDGLWQIQNTDDGEIIVATYEDPSVALEVKSSWAALADKTGSSINIFYKDQFIKKLASKDIGNDIDIKKLSEHLPESLEANKSLREAFINNFLTNDEREAFLSSNPELK